MHPYSFRSDKPRSLAEPQPDDEYSEEYVGEYSNIIVLYSSIIETDRSLFSHIRLVPPGVW